MESIELVLQFQWILSYIRHNLLRLFVQNISCLLDDVGFRIVVIDNFFQHQVHQIRSIRLYLSLSTYSVRLPLCFRVLIATSNTRLLLTRNHSNFINPINRDHINSHPHALRSSPLPSTPTFLISVQFRKVSHQWDKWILRDRFSNLLMLEPDSVTIQASATISASANGKRIFWLINYLSWILGEFQHAGIRYGKRLSRPSCPFRSAVQYKQYYFICQDILYIKYNKYLIGIV